MAKLTFLALALAALVAFATATTTIVTTTIDDENPFSEQRQCSQRVQGQRLNPCRMFLQQGQRGQHQQQQQQQQQQILQQCCNELQNIEEPCQCEAVRQVFRDVQQQQQRPRLPFLGSQQSQQLKQKAQALPNICNLQSRQCRIESISTVAESNFDIPFDIPFLPWPFRPSTESQQCREREIQRPVSQCQRFVEQQMRSPRPYQQSPYQQRPYQQRPYQQRPGQQQQQGLQQCCNELQNVRRECQCEAIKEVGRRMMRQQQGGQYGRQQQTQIVGRVLENLPNQCYLEVQQCNVPY